jgi:hypothetical protein
MNVEQLSVNTISLLALLISSFAISAIVEKKFRRRAILAGVEFIFFGALLGDNLGLGLVGTETLSAFAPLVSLIIGLFGFLFGLELAKVNPKNEVSLSGMALAALTLGLTALLAFYVSILVFPDLASSKSLLVGREKLVILGTKYTFLATEVHLWIGLTLGAMASVTSADAISGVLSRLNSRGPLTSILPRLAAPGQVFGIFVFGAAFAAAKAIESSSTLGWTVTEWTVGVIGMGAFCGILFWLFIGREETPVKVYLATIGVVTLVSGVAIVVGISPLFLNFVCGAVLTMTSPHSAQIASILKDLKGPLTVMLLFFAGTFFAPVGGTAWVLPAFFILLRIALLLVLPRLTVRHISEKSYAPGFGRAFLFQDVLIVVLSMDLVIRSHEIAQIVLTTAISAFIVFGSLGSFFLKRFLNDACEIDAIDNVGLAKKELAK